MTAPLPHARRATLLWAGAAIILLATLLAYLPALRGGFVWDDAVSLTENPLIPRRDGLFYFWFTSAPYDYFPLTFTSFFIEHRLWGLNPAGYHLTNVLLHALSSILLWRLLVRLKVPGAWVAGLIFALHPVCAASVAWVAERKNTLSMPFFLASIWWYLRSEEQAEQFKVQSSKPAGRWSEVTHHAPRTRHHISHFTFHVSRSYLLSLASFLLALLSKTSVVVLPIILFLLTWWQRPQTQPLTQHATRNTPHVSRITLPLLPFFALSLALGLVTVWFQAHRATGIGTVVQTENFWQRLAAAGCALWFYVGKALLPIRLSAVYPRWDFTAATAWSFLPLLVFVAVLGFAWRFRATWGRHLLFTLTAFALALLPILGFIDMFYLTYSRVADQWAYLALPFLIALVIGAATTWLRSKLQLFSSGRRFLELGAWSFSGVWCLVFGVCLWLAFATWQRATVYSSEFTLWRDTVQKNPLASSAHNNFGLALLQRGNYQEARRQLDEALRLKPAFPEALHNMGYLLDKMGRTPQASAYYEKALEVHPKYFLALNNWGVNLIEQGHTNLGLAKIEAALQINPNYAPAHENLAGYLLNKGAADEALPHALQALELDAENPDAFYIAGNCQFLTGAIREAAENYGTACRLRPDFAAAQHNLAVAWKKLGRENEAEALFAQVAALHPDDPNIKLQQGIILAHAGQLQQAVEQFQRVVRLGPKNPEGHNRLGFILAKQGKLDQALAEFKEALRLDPKSADAHKNLGNAWLESKQPALALPEFQEALRLQPTNGAVHAQFGAALVRLGKDAEAVGQFQEALRLEPENATAHYGWATLLLKQAQFAPAREHYLEAIKTKPDFAEAHYQLALVLQVQQNFPETLSHLREAIRLNPDWPEALNNLAWLLATHQDRSLRNGPEAVRLARRAVELRHSQDPEQLDTLGAAHAEAGQFDEAISAARKALDLASHSGQTNLLSAISSHLDLYQKRLPYHEP